MPVHHHLQLCYVALIYPERPNVITPDAVVQGNFFRGAHAIEEQICTRFRYSVLFLFCRFWNRPAPCMKTKPKKAATFFCGYCLTDESRPKVFMIIAPFLFYHRIFRNLQEKEFKNCLNHRRGRNIVFFGDMAFLYAAPT